MPRPTPPRLPYLHVTRAPAAKGGKAYCAYRRGALRVPLPHWSDPGFLAAYQRQHASFEESGAAAARPEIRPGSIADLVALYKAAPAFLELAPATRASYARYLDALAERHGRFDAAAVDREFALRLRDKHAATPRKANYLVALLRLLLTFALDRPRRFGVAANPIVKVRKLKTGAGYRPWPPALLEAAWRLDDPDLKAAIAAGAWLGQRIGDTVALPRPAYDGRAVRLVQAKTGTALEIAVHPALRQALAAARRAARRSGRPESLTLLARADGRPWTRFALAEAIRDFVRGQGLEGYSFHGLRKVAAQSLAEAGCSEAEIRAITGHATGAMVDRYTRGASQKRLAKAAVTKLRRAGKERAAGVGGAAGGQAKERPRNG